MRERNEGGIGSAKTAVTAMKKLLCRRSVSMVVWLSVLKCYVWSTLLYGCETNTLRKGMIKNLEAAGHRFLRRMLRIPLIDKVSTCEVFRRVGVEKGLLQDMISTQMSFIGQMNWKNSANWISRRNTWSMKTRETLWTYLSNRKGLKPSSEMIRYAIDMWIQLCIT